MIVRKMLVIIFENHKLNQITSLSIKIMFMIFDVLCWFTVYLSQDKSSILLNVILFELIHQNSSMINIEIHNKLQENAKIPLSK